MPQPSSKPGKIDMQKTIGKQMLYFMPLITVVIGASLPAGLILYWFITTLLTVFQQQIMFRKKEETVEVITDQNNENIQQ